ncbi:hypothetical protein TNCV_4906191 [Trichonephila clavipes]|uniref:Uncharacterized protein n=1 Tax=Trichonephila clavipes TaxID=2585209 RepID=A0A8X6V844_TRICX|nr:hypothetical protein TNCV_4906191 [Trichonephila clavipes]
MRAIADGSRSFNPRSSDEVNNGSSTPTSNFHITPTRRHSALGRFKGYQLIYISGQVREQSQKFVLTEIRHHVCSISA